MKLRAVAAMFALCMIGLTVANCGSEDGSAFSGGGGGNDGGTSTQPPGFGTSDGSVNTNTGACVKKTCADQGISCGPAGDGCGGVLEDCGKCQGQETCGGGGIPSQCGGTQGCVPRTCAQLGVECGPAGDGCGALLDCQTCPAPQICGGGGPSKCGGGQIGTDGGVLLPDGGACVGRTTCNAGECGPIADGCGGLLNCPSTCPAGQTCGGGGVASMCGAPTCTKTTCTAQNANCGFVADGCGGLLDCGGASACTNPGDICGGGGPNRCGAGTDGGSSCINYCQDQVKNETCAPGTKTKISGKIFAPNGTLPLPDALIYIPNESKTFPHGVTTFTDGVAAGACDQCSGTASGSPLISTKSAADGSFTLDNVPPKTAFPLVIQLGRWRRMVTVPALTKCTSNPLSPQLTRMPTRQNEGNSRDNIPLIAISTGQVDGLECVFRKLGIEDSQFGNPTGFTGAGGRIRLYRDNFFDVPNTTQDAQGGARYNNNTPRTDTALTNTQANLDQYDAVIFGCAGAENNRSNAILDRVRAYADKGGRVFATHYEYVYLYNRAPWNTTAAWDVEDRSSNNGSWVGEINTSPGKRLLFSQWLGDPAVNALSGTAPPRITIQEARNDVDRNVFAGGEEWITRYQDNDTPTAVLHYTFNTPVNQPPANQCGRVLYSDFHVSIGNTSGETFPDECNNDALTAQEKVLAFFLFDLTSCIEPITPPPPPTCTPLTCAQQGIACGQAGNGCGGQITCPDCPNGQVCQGSPAQCVTPPCTPRTCPMAGAECGVISDGCGSTVNCGPCTQPGEVCGGSGPNQCGTSSCTPTTCQAQNIQCGPAGNGCGGLLDCGPCPQGQTCGGGGTPGVCGAPNCTKRTCQDANANCGFVADGCGGLLDCGPCPSGQSCGGGGVANQCGGGNVPK